MSPLAGACDARVAQEQPRPNGVTRALCLCPSVRGLRIVGVGTKRIPKYWILLGISFFGGDEDDVGLVAATGASILSAPIINPIRMIEKQQRAYLKQVCQALSTPCPVHSCDSLES